MFAPKTPKEVAYRELRTHLVTLGVWCMLIRGSTYALHLAYRKN